ncbi:MAG TPA: UDP-N-acetylmuramoyl-L-alanine--D-glutamate ligase [Sphingomicrobium sp.]|nr:UDP-N-acetylmuramoyl-L-alanine--D-glutamate ligase [Sphingomicrobium sp.]
MITAKVFAGKHYAVYGLARSGLATVDALLASGAKVTAWDAKLAPSPRRGEGRGAGAQPPSELASAEHPHPALSLQGEGLVIADLDTADLAQFDSLVVTPGLPLNRHPIAQRAHDAGVEIIGDIELFARARPELPPHKVVGITGTNGKSTTTALIHHILATAGVPSAMGGNIGLPILAQDPLPEGGVYVLELSSYQLDLTQSLDCDIAVLLNITPDHLDRYESFEAYAESKVRLFHMQWYGRAAIYRIVDTLEFGFGLTDNLETEFIEDIIDFREKPFLSERQKVWPALQGPHNLYNAASAERVCELLGLKDNQIEQALRTYPGLPHRMERVRERDGVVFVNDSKATNPTATAPALAAFDKIRWICGGQAKTDNLDECAPHFGHVRKAYTIGEAGELFASLLSPHMAVAQCETLERAVGEAAGEAESGDTVLLSPACASFDQFRDFEDRGDQFRRLVEGL